MTLNASSAPMLMALTAPAHAAAFYVALERSGSVVKALPLPNGGP